MALLMTKVGETGITTNYHKISSVHMNETGVHCTVNSYVSEKYREAEKQADTSRFRFDITVEEEESMGIRALCYRKIKALPEWSEATDC